MLFTYMKILWEKDPQSVCYRTIWHLKSETCVLFDPDQIRLASTRQDTFTNCRFHWVRLFFLPLTLLRTLWQNAMSGSKSWESKSSWSVSSDRRRLAFIRYTLDTYGTFHTPLGNKTNGTPTLGSTNLREDVVLTALYLSCPYILAIISTCVQYFFH